MPNFDCMKRDVILNQEAAGEGVESNKGLITVPILREARKASVEKS